jgi:hypothetical protein
MKAIERVTSESKAFTLKGVEKGSREKGSVIPFYPFWFPLAS